MSNGTKNAKLGESKVAAPLRDKTSFAGKPFAGTSFVGSTVDPGVPEAMGLYDPALDKDSCGVGFVAIIEDGLRILCNLEHRGATGADPRMGDGAGILVQIPHKFFAKEAKRLGFTLPAPGQYAVGQLFMPHETNWQEIIRDIYEDVIDRE